MGTANIHWEPAVYWHFALSSAQHLASPWPGSGFRPRNVAQGGAWTGGRPLTFVGTGSSPPGLPGLLAAPRQHPPDTPLPSPSETTSRPSSGFRSTTEPGIDCLQTRHRLGERRKRKQLLLPVNRVLLVQHRISGHLPGRGVGGGARDFHPSSTPGPAGWVPRIRRPGSFLPEAQDLAPRQGGSYRTCRQLGIPVFAPGSALSSLRVPVQAT